MPLRTRSARVGTKDSQVPCAAELLAARPLAELSLIVPTLTVLNSRFRKARRSRNEIKICMSVLQICPIAATYSFTLVPKCGLITNVTVPLLCSSSATRAGQTTTRSSCKADLRGLLLKCGRSNTLSAARPRMDAFLQTLLFTLV